MLALPEIIPEALPIRTGGSMEHLRRAHLRTDKRMHIVRCLSWLLLLVALTTVQAQTPGPLSNPNLNLVINGTVHAIARLPDGSIVFGGFFTSVNGTPRANIAKLQPDGTLDPTWNPSASDGVTALAISASGDIYVGGNFLNMGGQGRSYLAKLSGNGTGAVDANWSLQSNGPVNQLVIDAGGSIYAAGSFSIIGGQSRSNIAKLSGSGSGAVDANWNPSANGIVLSLAIDTSGNV